ncbi:hypothetical protein CGCA056_v009470 [Colletotrichum aenigma]|uniref:uncharacterized protein n=1 Tax=Colletotrichum aenigma TaxID=1215731 RepID=UPI001872E546|nr:uncharacterized protein CGCA056_v009470 [Colletotrichum aenigma]KAF5518880.1 hypothetical protein CGCA056_v009470 [Colletotrichum aenigma]
MEIAASGFAFVQVGVGAGKAIVQAIQLWEQVKQVPRELQSRIHKLKLFKQIISQIEDEFARHPDLRARPTAQQCLEHVRNAEAALLAHVEKMSALVQRPKSKLKRHVNSFKIISLKKEELAALESELAWAMELMQLAISMFHLVKAELSEEIIVNQTSNRVREYSIACQEDVIQKTAQAVVQMMRAESLPMIDAMSSGTVVSHKDDNSGQTEKGQKRRHWPSYFETTLFGRYTFRRSRNDEGWIASLQIPWSQRVTELRWTGWQYRFHSYNIRPKTAPVFKAAEKGDIRELTKLFRTGQASPFDRNEAGRSLLYLAAKEERLEVCEMLIRKGVPADDEREKHGYNPIDAIVVSRQNFTGADDENHASLVALFESAAYTSDTLTVKRLFNFVAEFSQSDDFLRVYQSQFLRNYQRLPIRDRAEAVRLGSFLVRDATTYRRLLNPATKAVTPADTRESVNEKLSLVHSAAIALGKRLADELQYDPKAFRARSYTDAWSDVVIETVESANSKDLHGVETVVPWDWFRVPVWRGTPLMSLLGGALCRLAPEIPISKWDSVFQRVLGQWLQDLQEAGVDLSEYGKGEVTAQKLCPEIKGAFDSDAINASRVTVRNELQEPSKESWMNAVDAEFDQSDRYWMPIRIIALDYGPRVKDWSVRWLVEWEAFAGEFWRTVEAPRVTMPGSWID